MNSIKNIIVNQNISIRDALKIIDKNSKQICLIVENEKLIGTLTDGDIRRGLLNGLDLDSSIKSIIFTKPTTCRIEDSKEKILKLALTNQLQQIPVLDNKGGLVGLRVVDELLKPKVRLNSVVLMAGGLGARLMPLTEDIPKPMLEVGGKPILQTIVEGFANHGFTNITMCLGYRPNVVKNFFKDGKEFGVHIDYIIEEKRMGTAGALSLIKKKFNEPIFVMNGDLLTKIDYGKVIDFHKNNNSKATMCVSKYDVKVPYGVINISNKEITSIQEKPIHSFFVNTGIYLIEPECIDIIPKGEYYDMTTLFEQLIAKNVKTISFPLSDYWLDIGRMEDFKKANYEYYNIF